MGRRTRVVKVGDGEEAPKAGGVPGPPPPVTGADVAGADLPDSDVADADADNGAVGTVALEVGEDGRTRTRPAAADLSMVQRAGDTARALENLYRPKIPSAAVPPKKGPPAGGAITPPPLSDIPASGEVGSTPAEG